jgi:hypothetical protein
MTRQVHFLGEYDREKRNNVYFYGFGVEYKLESRGKQWKHQILTFGQWSIRPYSVGYSLT